MPKNPSPDSALAFGDRFERLGRTLGEREREHSGDLQRARACAEELHAAVAVALEEFHRAARAAGSPHLAIELSDIRTNDKHLRAVEFELARGRHRAIVTAKSRGKVTLVGPFHKGKVEGPCRSFPLSAGSELGVAVGDFLEKFLEDAAAP